ncbi:MAG TPA: ABC transporter ATP-binding protein [Thermoanaerobaculia bacterium]|nr:ABC transporter ATP-binding protein [Thermoanaerobaculia bacterium]
MPDSACVVRFEGASKRYGSLLALRPIDLEIGAGELFALVGPNGAGKTTALGLLTGLLTPTSGRVLVGGLDVAADPVGAKRRIGFVPDRPLLWPRWTPRESLRFVGAVFGMAGGRLERAIEAEISAFALDGDADTRNEALSHGTRQRVALAQAFLHAPDVLVLDEPMVGLDPFAQRTLATRRRERAAAGAAVVFTTHQLSTAADLATTAGLLVGGRLAAWGPPRSLTTPDGRSGPLEELFFEAGGRGSG